MFVLDNLSGNFYICLNQTRIQMKTMTVGEFKAQFSEVIEQVKAGEKIAVTFGKKKEVIGYFTPDIRIEKKNKRILGILENKAVAVFDEKFEMTEEEFLGI